MYFAVAKKGDLPVDGKTDVNPEGLTAACGKHARAFAERMEKGGSLARQAALHNLLGSQLVSGSRCHRLDSRLNALPWSSFFALFKGLCSRLEYYAMVHDDIQVKER